MNKNGCLVLLSGGQDSTTVLYEALRSFDRVEALAIDYGQRHARELRAAEAIASLAKVHLHRAGVQIPVSSALTTGGEITTRPDGLPSTFVPGRNAIFLAIAAGVASDRGLRTIGIGCSAVDYSGYPDCRQDFLDQQESALSLAVEDARLRIWAPFVHASKADTVRGARLLKNGVWEALALSWTCYLGGEQPCGTCPACVLRAKGFAEAGEADPAL